MEKDNLAHLKLMLDSARKIKEYIGEMNKQIGKYLKQFNTL